MHADSGNDKLARLRRLAELSQWAPETLWEASEVPQNDVVRDAAWYIRADESWTGERGPLSTDEALRLLHSNSGRIALQRFIEAELSGAAWYGPTISMVEATKGDSRRLFRNGNRGARCLFDEAWRSVWQDSCPTNWKPDWDFILTSIGRLARTSNGIIREGDLVEWIIDYEGRFLAVDLKQVGDDYLTFDPPTAPKRFWIAGHRAGVPSSIIADTSYSNLALLDHQHESFVQAQSGSPLSHLCVAAAARGVQMCIGPV